MLTFYSQGTAEILSMKDTGSKITICNDTMDENFYIKGIIYIMLCHVYKPKFVMTFPPQISHSVFIYTSYIISFLVKITI